MKVSGPLSSSSASDTSSMVSTSVDSSSYSALTGSVTVLVTELLFHGNNHHFLVGGLSVLNLSYSGDGFFSSLSPIMERKSFSFVYIPC